MPKGVYISAPYVVDRSLEDSSVIESYRKTLWVSHLEN